MTLEVEIKFKLTDPNAVEAQLSRLNAIAEPPVEQSDRYYNHPARDFRLTDEAFRIRSVGSANCITYKGPKLDALTKTRREIEIPMADGPLAAQQMADLLIALGFQFAREVRKLRTPFRLMWQQTQYELALDRVDPLGSFLEIELIADESTRDAATNAILKLAAELGLSNPERRSYLELLEENDGHP